MKRIAYYALHYGKEYLAWSLRSVQDAVDEIHVLYADRPTFGHASRFACPDSEAELRREAERFLHKPLIWHKGHWPSEAAHRDAIRQIATDRGAQLVLVVDADEVWDPASARAILDATEAHNAAGSICARFVHFWRSFNHVCQDPCMPTRVLDLRHPWQSTWYGATQPVPVLHFGYAQSEAVMRYKWTCHGHQAEFRSRWMEEKFIGWAPGMGDVHPTCRDFWSPEPTADAKVVGNPGQGGIDLGPIDLPAHVAALLSDHPYYGMRVIP